MVDEINFRVESGVLWININRVKKKNALNIAVLESLDDILEQYEMNQEIKAIVLGTQKDAAFSAGGDIHAWGLLKPLDMAIGWIAKGNRVFQRLADFPAPSIAFVDGIAFGGGLELALACDLRVATSAARFKFPELALGLLPGWQGCSRLQALIGTGRAREMIMLGREIDASEAYQWGMINHYGSFENMQEILLNWLNILNTQSREAIWSTKKLLNQALNIEHMSHAHELAAALCQASPDGQRAIQIFHERKNSKYR